MSIQEASVYLLEQYYKDFPVFNPWLENAQQTQGKRHGAFSTKSAGITIKFIDYCYRYKWQPWTINAWI